MGFGRDLGAAMTFGLSATTKHKEAEAENKAREKLHTQRVSAYNETQEQAKAIVSAMDANFTAAQKVLLSTGALTSDVDNNVIYGWYKPQEEVEGVDSDPEYSRSAIGAIPAFGLGIGTPAAIWTVVGIYGTAATGTAIGTLSGAAASAATAAWIGRAATFGLGGMTAGRIAMGPIGVAAALVTLPLGAALAGKKERRYIQESDEAMRKMDCVEECLEECGSRFNVLEPRMAVVTADMHRHTSQLEKATPNTPEAQDIAGRLDKDMRRAAALNDELSEAIQHRDKGLESCGMTG